MEELAKLMGANEGIDSSMTGYTTDVGELTTINKELKKQSGNTELSRGTELAINAGASAIGGLLSARAAQKAEQRKLNIAKANNRVTIEQQKASLQNSTLQSLAANLANTIMGGR